MGKAVDFEKVRRRRRRIQTLKRLCLLALIVSAVITIIYLNDLFIEQGLPTKVNDIVESFGGTGYPVSLPGGVIRDSKSLGKHMIVLNDTNMYIYNAKGKTVRNIQQMSDNTVIKTTENRVMAFDPGAKRYSIHSLSTQLLTKELPDNILSADLGVKDYHAIVTSPRHHLSEVNVYDGKGDRIYRWASADNLTLDVSLSPKENMMAVGCVNAENGAQLGSTVYLFRFSVEEVWAQVDLAGDMVMAVDFYDEHRIGVLTDNRYILLDDDGRIQASVSFDGAPVSAFRRLGANVMVLLDHRENRTQELLLLDGEANVTAKLAPAAKLRDMALGTRHIYLLDEKGVAVYNYQLALDWERELRGVSRIHAVGDKLYYFTHEEICLLEKPEAQKEEA